MKRKGNMTTLRSVDKVLLSMVWAIYSFPALHMGHLELTCVSLALPEMEAVNH